MFPTYKPGHVAVHGPEPDIDWSQDRSKVEDSAIASEGASEEAPEVASSGSRLGAALGRP